MAMHDPPFSVLTPKDGSHGQRVQRGFAAPDLAVVSLDLDDICKLGRCVFGNALESEYFALAQLGCGALQRFRDLRPAPNGLASVTSSRREYSLFFGSGSPFTIASSA
jgi:hypothetical protein